jgi:UDP-GlcNAc:undecaprenyl-phosphate GlcNAc-1-phosphate transferase
VTALLLACLSIGLSAAATAWVRRTALARGFLDHPTPVKPHRRAVPTLGGLGVGGPFLLLLWVGNALAGDPLARGELVSLTLAGALVLALGVYDDLHGCRAGGKLLVQVVAAGILYGGGFAIERLTNPFDDAVPLSGLMLPVTILWLVGITNAVNLIDGSDGLASTVVLIAAVTLFAIAGRFAEHNVRLTALLLAGTLIGFLPFNLPPARIFLGDTGSLFLGLMIAAISLLHDRKGALTITLLLPVVLLALPILDTTLALCRRILGLRHPFRGDTEHLHHRLLRLGLTPRQVVVIAASVSGLLGLTAFVLTLLPKQYTMVAVVVLALALATMLVALLRQERKALARRPPAVEPGPSPAPRS